MENLKNINDGTEDISLLANKKRQSTKKKKVKKAVHKSSKMCIQMQKKALKMLRKRDAEV